MTETEELVFQFQLTTYVDIEIIRQGHGKKLPKLKDLLM